ncbi:hypothetical protein [Methylobacterium sp. Leaf93]|uniref:hypothetical protein n=1 Tax=Methylobacterium sp. Leaf93 TaxID=1736249 RepID=UPI00138F4505|nr:hypothetical protein [Methylobacterium sp. Leaf93]
MSRAGLSPDVREDEPKGRCVRASGSEDEQFARALLDLHDSDIKQDDLAVPLYASERNDDVPPAVDTLELYVGGIDPRDVDRDAVSVHIEPIDVVPTEAGLEPEAVRACIRA